MALVLDLAIGIRASQPSCGLGKGDALLLPEGRSYECCAATLSTRGD